MRATSDSPDPLRAKAPAGEVAPPAPVTFYHWMVVLLCAGGWLFDCMGQRIFVLSRQPALRELLGNAATEEAVRSWGGLATLVMMVGWATGGIVFGMMGDRYGRVRAMITTLLAYTVFSGLSGFAHSPGEFLAYRLLFGLGVGGMFGSATTLVAESVPSRVRTLALGAMQALSACGDMLASGLSYGIAPGSENFWGHYSGWQVLSFVSICPALLAIPMALVLKEPDAWKRAKAEAGRIGSGKAVGSMRDMFGHPRWRQSLIVGVCLGVAGMVGLWGIAFFSPELITAAFRDRPLQPSEILDPSAISTALRSPPNAAVSLLKARLSPAMVREVESQPNGAAPGPAFTKDLCRELNHVIRTERIYDSGAFHSIELRKATQNLVVLAQTHAGQEELLSLNRQLVEQLFPGAIRELRRSINTLRSQGTMLQDMGALLGMFCFTFVASCFSRRRAFLLAFLLCIASVSLVFSSLRTVLDVYWMLPLMGFATLSVFAGYSIYFPELFPTRLRGTGVGLCYNTVRYLAAPFPLLLGWLSTRFPFRVVAVAMGSIYLVGILALVWAPETKGQPLPED